MKAIWCRSEVANIVNLERTVSRLRILGCPIELYQRFTHNYLAIEADNHVLERIRKRHPYVTFNPVTEGVLVKTGEPIGAWQVY